MLSVQSEFKPIIPEFDNPLVEVFINHMQEIYKDGNFVATIKYKNELRKLIEEFGNRLRGFVAEQQHINIYPYLYVFTRFMALFAKTADDPAKTQLTYFNIIKQESVKDLLLLFHNQLRMSNYIINCIQYLLYTILTDRSKFLAFNCRVFTFINQNIAGGHMLNNTITFLGQMLWDLYGNMELHNCIIRLTFLDQEPEPAPVPVPAPAETEAAELDDEEEEEEEEL